MKKIKNLYVLSNEFASEEMVIETTKLHEEVSEKFSKLGYSKLQTKVFENILSNTCLMAFDIDVEVHFGFIHDSHYIINPFLSVSFSDFVNPFVEYGEDVLRKGNYIPLLKDIVKNINNDLKEEEVQSYIKQKIEGIKERSIREFLKVFKYQPEFNVFKLNLDIFED